MSGETITRCVMFFMLTYTGVFCAVSLIIDRAARHGAQQTGFWP